MKQSSRQSLLAVLRNVLFGIVLFVLAFFLVGNVWNFVDEKTGYRHPFLGFRSAVVVTDSMSFVNDANKDELKDYPERIYKDDVVLARMDFTFDTLEKNDVILFVYEDVGLVCHRVYDTYVEDDGTEMVVTRGDANAMLDDPIPFTNVVGRVYDVIPKVGAAILFFQSPYGLLAVSLVIFFVCLGFFIAGRERNLYKTLTKGLL